MTSGTWHEVTAATSRPVDIAYDPAFLPEFYIDWIYGDCCEPAIHHQDGVLVSKSAPVRRGDLVAIVARTPGEREGRTNGFVKRFIGWERSVSGRVLVTEMLNPRRRRVFPAEQVIAVHRVINVISMGSAVVVDQLEKLAEIAKRNGGLCPPVGRNQ